MKILSIFGLMTVVLIGVECENLITQAMRENEVIPDVVSDGADQQLEVFYESAVILYPGCELTPTVVRNQPIKVYWYAEDDAYYTLIFTTPDAPTRSAPVNREVIKWLIVNIPGNDIDSGEELVEYTGAGAPRGAGLNRYVYLVYKQPGKEQFDEQYIDKYTDDPRKNFSTTNFIHKYNMGPSSDAANFFQAGYDDSVPDLYKQLNCCQDLL